MNLNTFKEMLSKIKRVSKDKCFDYSKRRTCNGCLVCKKHMNKGETFEPDKQSPQI